MNASDRIVHVVDDDESLRVAVSRMLRIAGYEVRDYRSAGEFLRSSPEAACGCVLLDVKMPGMNGPALQNALAQVGSSLPIVFLTGHGDVHSSVSAMKAGAIDFLTKPVKKDVLIGAIDAALRCAEKRRAEEEQRQRARTCLDELTAREYEVYQGVVTGKQNKQIASALGISLRTVKAHRAKVMQKMRAGTLVDLIRTADQLGA